MKTATNTNLLDNALPQSHAALLDELGWSHCGALALPARPAAFAADSDLPTLPDPARRLIDEGGPLYRHQAAALRLAREGKNVVVATGTGSGKTRVFHLAAAALLADQPRALVLALYPGKALAREQAAKWSRALADAGLRRDGGRSVALVTGDQPASTRAASLQLASVAILTPDVLHSWLLANLGNRTLRSTLARARLIAIDEAHTLAGVFGSNTLYLLRRLQHVLRALDAPDPQWLAASATLSSPSSHLESLVGRPFSAIGDADDTSARHERRLHFIRPPSPDLLTSGLQRWLQAVATDSQPRFVVFTQSRKRAELIAQLANRAKESDSRDEPDEALDPGETLLSTCPRLAPYRSGLDPSERAELQDRFASGDLRGLVCTSAFELGIDLPGLNLGFLVGLPASPASFWQRLGRFGRHGESDVFLIDDGSAQCEAAFESPRSVLDWQASDAALYPENPILLARHALCLAHETEALGLLEPALDPDLPLPAALRSLSQAQIRGEPTQELRDALAAQGNAQPPHTAFPLRHFDDSYTFKGFHGCPAPTGFITYAQILREAYPGAVYYHGGKAWRVHGLVRRNRTLLVGPEKQYHTKPRCIPTTILPDLNATALNDLRWDDGLRVIESQARATEAVTGFVELRGSISSDHDYAQGAYNQAGPLYRSYDTTAVLLSHPSLDAAPTSAQVVLAALLREALALCCPREASELAAATGALKVARRGLEANRRFVALYDTVPGSLRLSGALAEPATLRTTLSLVERLAAERFASHQDPDMRCVARLAAALSAAATAAPSLVELDWPERPSLLAFQPGTVALHRKRQCPVRIERYFTDLDGELYYEVTRIEDPAFHGTVAASALVEIEGVTRIAPLAN